jgi:hypothetical protein
MKPGLSSEDFTLRDNLVYLVSPVGLEPTYLLIKSQALSANLATKTAEKVGTEIFEVFPNTENSNTHLFNDPPAAPWTPTDDIPPDDLPEDDVLEQWEINEGITLGADGERIVGGK